MHCCPYKVLAQVKCQLRRSSICKSHDMTVNKYFAAIQRINKEELPCLPPHFNNTQKLPKEELVEILYYGIPNSSWKNEMTKQGFDPLDSTLYNFWEFCQRLEDLPDFQEVESKKKDGPPRNRSLILARRKIHPRLSTVSSMVKVTTALMTVVITRI